jgi:hypothetical protein
MDILNSLALSNAEGFPARQYRGEEEIYSEIFQNLPDGDAPNIEARPSPLERA